MGLEAIGAQLETFTQDWSNGVQHPDWPIKIVAAKYNAVETAWKIADRALEVSGGFGMFKKSEMERLFRDARAGRFHPANSSLDARADRQAGARHQPRRSAALGLGVNGLAKCEWQNCGSWLRIWHWHSDAELLRIPLEPELARRRHVADERGRGDDGGAGEIAFAAEPHPVLPVAVE